MNEEDKKYVIAHEKAHIKRFDYLWKPFGFLILSVYWFNPVLWLAYILLCRDIEYACDERVIKSMGKEIKKPYSTALINCSAQRKLISACPIAFGETDVKGRIKSVLNYRKPAFWVIIIAVIASIVTGICFMTNPKSENNTPEKDDIFSQNTEELPPEVTTGLSYFKEFKGGKDYIVSSEDSSHYEYNGGEMSVDFTINNISYGFECGIFVVLNGVYQEFTLSSGGSDSSQPGYLAKINVPESKSVDLTLKFTPNTGKAGDVMNLSVGTMLNPSYTAVYSGWPHYSKYNYHSYDGISGMTVRMNKDGSAKAAKADINVEKTDISDVYYDILTASSEDDMKQTAWESDGYFVMYSGEYDRDRDIILAGQSDSVNVSLDVFGKATSHRISLFVNNSLVTFGEGKTYIEVETSVDKVSHVTIPLDISTIPDNSHIYAIDSVIDSNKDSFTYGTYIYSHKAPTCFLIKGELPEIELTDKINPPTVSETTEQQNQTPVIASGEIKVMKDLDIIYMAPIDAQTMCFVCRGLDGLPKAVFYDVVTKKTVGRTELENNSKYYAVSSGKLLSFENVRIVDGTCKTIDKNGNVIGSFSYVDNVSAEDECKMGSSMFATAFKKVAADPVTGDFIYIASGRETKTTYYVSYSQQTKTKLDFLSGENLPVEIKHFSNNNILTLKTENGKSTATLINIDGTIVQQKVYESEKTVACCGAYAVIFDRKNETGRTSDNKVQLLSFYDGSVRDIILGSDTEGQWCTVSPDGNYVLTYDNSVSFKLYDTASSALVESFEITNIEPGIINSKVYIDGTNRVIYFQTANNDIYGTYIKNF